ncbi:RHS Repeat protein [compost metagenome]
MTWPDSVYVAYGWDLSNAMTDIRLNGAGLITGYAYDDLGRRTGITRGVGGAATAYAYDGGGRLLSLTQPPPPNDQDARKKCS